TAAEGDAEVRDRNALLALLAEALRLEHPGRERRERPEQARSREQQRVARHREAGQQAERERAAEVDGERPERERARRAPLDEAVELEAQYRAGAAEQRHADPDSGRHHARVLRVSALARYTEARPVARVAAT